MYISQQVLKQSAYIPEGINQIPAINHNSPEGNNNNKIVWRQKMWLYATYMNNPYALPKYMVTNNIV